MKIVVGIDPRQDITPMVDLIGRLRFADAAVLCASIAPMPISSISGLGAWPDATLTQVLNAQRSTACRALEEAESSFGRAAIPAESVFEIGNAAFHLASLAESKLADVIAVGSREVGPGPSFFLGSVGRALTIQTKRSLLIAKGSASSNAPVKAVFAYDASDYCLRSVDELIRLRPLGISHIELLVIDTLDPDSSPVTDLLGEEAFHDGKDRRHKILLEHAETAAVRLRSAGYDVRTVCHTGQVNDLIRGQVIDSDADLVIIGAQGHGWLERALFGSVALAQAVDEPHSVLILRPRIA